MTEFTISSHHPYHVPEQYKGKLPQGPLPIQQCVAYTDLSLRRFFETVRRMPWYRNTLFVITADHAVTGVRPEYSHLVGRFSIPFILYDPRGELVGQDRTTLQQADFLPTLLDLLGLQRETVSFGHNVFSPPHRISPLVRQAKCIKWYKVTSCCTSTARTPPVSTIKRQIPPYLTTWRRKTPRRCRRWYAP